MNNDWWDNTNLIAVIAVIVSVATLIITSIISITQARSRNKFEQRQIETQNTFVVEQANQRTSFEAEQAQVRLQFEKELAKRREELDREFAEKTERLEFKLRSNQSFADYHLQRRDILSQLLANITIAKGYFDDARNMGLSMCFNYHVDKLEVSSNSKLDGTPEFVRQNELRKSFITKGTEIATLALANAEQYGYIPIEFKLSPQILSPYCERVIRSKLFNLHAYHMTDEIIEESNEHISKIKHDIRTLMQMELVLAERMYSNNLTESNLLIPNLFYIEQCVKWIKTREPNSADMNFSHMEKG